MGFDIGSIETRHETSAELSISSGDDALASWSIHSGCARVVAGSSPWCVKPSKSAPHVGIRFHLVGFDIGSIEPRHETSAELSITS